MSEKKIVWLHTEIKTPPFSEIARIQAGVLLRRLQYGEILSMPHSKPLTVIGKQCYELRIKDAFFKINWRIIYHISSDFIVVLDTFEKRTSKIPRSIIKRCQERLDQFYDTIIGEGNYNE